MFDLNGFQRDLLHVVAGHEKLNGLEIKAELEAYYGTDINHSRLYPSLNNLADKGLIEKGSIDQRTNFYSVTQRGRRELVSHHEWERELVDDAGSV